MTEMKVDYIHIILRGGLLAIVCTLLSVVWVNDPMLPAGELSGQWAYLAKAAMGAATGLLLLAFVYYKKRYDMGRDFYQVVVWSLIALAASEAVYGLRQLYGFTSSHHSLYSLTGSFFNPGPYSGFLVMVLPVVLFYCLSVYPGRQKSVGEWRYKLESGFVWGILWLILSILLPDQETAERAGTKTGKKGLVGSGYRCGVSVAVVQWTLSDEKRFGRWTPFNVENRWSGDSRKSLGGMWIGLFWRCIRESAGCLFCHGGSYGTRRVGGRLAGIRV